MKRLNPCSDLPEEITQYYTTRALQLKPYGFSLLCVKHFNSGKLKYSLGIFTKDNKNYISFYMHNAFRGKGFSERYLECIHHHLNMENATAITLPECNLESWFEKNNIPHLVLRNTYLEYEEYSLMSKFYGDQKARRSGLYMMNHIDEGVAIMIERKASVDAIKAFIAHPMLQDDEHIADFDNIDKNEVFANCSKKVILLCAEYRKIANAYLCKPYTDNWTINDIRDATSLIIRDVHEMLVADKVQNLKDFMQYHALTHPRRTQLFTYFNKWIKLLDCEIYAQNWISSQSITVNKPNGC